MQRLRRIRRTAVLVTAVAVTCLSATALVAPASATNTGRSRHLTSRLGRATLAEPTLPSPESEVNVTGTPFTGTRPDGTVYGLIDAHSHMFMQDGMGGAAVCGKVFSEHGIETALRDCPSHEPHGLGALLENLTRNGSPIGTHDTTGWPTFADWPAHDSLTHQQMYYRWVERAWRGGQRVLVNDLVTNGAAVHHQPGHLPELRRDDGDPAPGAGHLRPAGLRRRAVRRAGPGLVPDRTSSEQARQVIEEGKLAVVLGVETSEPFGCKQTLRIPNCSRADIDAGLDELYDLGVRSMYLCHKFDNALCGVRFDEGSMGTIINAGQFLSTGTWWDARSCPADQPHDNNPGNGELPPELEDDLPPVLPLYPPGTLCNTKGLSGLGAYAVRGMVERDMMVEIDHMSAKAADQTLDILEEEDYPGVLSTHSWMDESYLDRLYSLGGFATIYGHAAHEFVEEYERTAPVRDRYGAGIGFGFDMNGFGGTPPPRDDAAANPVTYPFRSFDGGTLLDRQTTGQRTWDVNVDGVAHYGLVPDYVEDLRLVGGQEIIDDLARGPESYLTTWAGAEAH